MKLGLSLCRIPMLVGVLAGTAAFANIVPLDPFTPGDAIAFAEIDSQGNLIENETNVLVIVPSTSDIPATAFASLTNGAVGIRIVGGPGIGGNAGAGLEVNETFSGTGDNVVNFDIDGTWGVQGDPETNGVRFRAFIRCFAILDEAQRQGHDCGEAVADEYSTEGPTTPANISFPLHLALAFHTDPADTQFQFTFSLSGTAFGAATLNAIHTGLISFDLAPGVTMDQSNGFLTAPGDPTLPGEEPPPSTVPEPSFLLTAGAAVAALIGRHAWARSRS